MSGSLTEKAARARIPSRTLFRGILTFPQSGDRNPRRAVSRWESRHLANLAPVAPRLSRPPYARRPLASRRHATGSFSRWGGWAPPSSARSLVYVRHGGSDRLPVCAIALWHAVVGPRAGWPLSFGLLGAQGTHPDTRTKKPDRLSPSGFIEIKSAGNDLLSPGRTTIGRLGLTAVFGMGTGVSPSVCSPARINIHARKSASRGVLKKSSRVPGSAPKDARPAPGRAETPFWLCGKGTGPTSRFQASR